MSRSKPLKKSLFSPSYDRFLSLFREARVNADLTQVEAAKRVGKPQSFISKCENGERRVDVIELLEFSRAYGFSAVTFVEKLASRRRSSGKPKMG